MDVTSSSTIKVNLPKGILENSLLESQRIGISLQDFIRMLLATYFSRSESIQAISRDQMLLERMDKELAEGKYKDFTSIEDLKKHIMKL